MTDLLKRISQQPDQIDSILSKMSPSSTDIIKAISELTKEFIEPVKHLLTTNDEGEKYYDPVKTAHVELSGLMLGLLKDDFPNLQAFPEDDHLYEVFDNYGIEITQPEVRKNFFETWMASRTCIVIQQMLVYLEKQADSKSKEIRSKLFQLSNLYSSELPSSQREAINKLISYST